MLRRYLKESTEFFKNEDNPLFYLFIIPKLVKGGADAVKGDQVLKDLVDLVEESTKTLNVKPLVKKYSPITFFNLFATETVKKNDVEYIKQYLDTFEQDLAMEEKDFLSSYKVHQVFVSIKDSDVFKKYLKNL